jgi:hypothetical protein
VKVVKEESEGNDGGEGREERVCVRRKEGRQGARMMDGSEGRKEVKDLKEGSEGRK